ncbi:MAG: hypothetical protein PHV66_02665 [Bacteroidales bacterium]|nr:hypothetical protein [Bacteroidales bacterium]
MANKKVQCFLVVVSEGFSFEEMLLSDDCKYVYNVSKQKKVEISLIEKNKNGTITGLFVATQNKNIPPAHEPGNDEYSAVPLKNGEGLAYPNVFLYCTKTKTFYLESNRAGVSGKIICDYFIEKAKQNKIPGFSMALNIILTEDAYNRVKGSKYVKKVEFQVANPILLLQQKVIQDGPVKDFSKLAKEVNASKSIGVTLSGKTGIGGLIKKKVIEIMDNFSNIYSEHTPKGRARNKLIVYGVYEGEDGEGEREREEVIDFFSDRVTGYFSIEDFTLAKDLQPKERKDGILGVYVSLYSTIAKIIGVKESI